MWQGAFCPLYYYSYATNPPANCGVDLPQTGHCDKRLSANLTRREVACRCGCGFDSLAEETVAVFQGIRDFINRPIIITSGCRCPDRNAAIGGAVGSQHMLGAALDMRVDGWSDRQFGAMIKEAHKQVPVVRELLRYCEFANSRNRDVVHMDTGRVRNRVFGW